MASRLRSRRCPRLGGPPYWRLHAEAVAAQVPDAGYPLVLVGHSGACPLLPAIGTAIDGTVSAYVLVDGDLPLAPGSGGSRLDLLREASPALADELEALLAAGGSFPTWGDEDLVEEIPEQRLTARVVAEVRPQPREFWAEPLPAIPSWPDAPCGYLELSPSTRRPALAPGTRDGDTATSAADTSRCSCGPPTWPTRSSSWPASANRSKGAFAVGGQRAGTAWARLLFLAVLPRAPRQFAQIAPCAAVSSHTARTVTDRWQHGPVDMRELSVTVIAEVWSGEKRRQTMSRAQPGESMEE